MGAFSWMVWGWIGAAAATAALLFVVSAPYGRHRRPGWGPQLPAVAGWALMEGVSLVVIAGLFVAGGRFDDPAAWVFFIAWALHYVNRSVVHPLRARLAGTLMPVSIVAMAVVFNGMNAGLNGAWLFHLAPPYGAAWLSDPRFVVGAALFVLGAVINLDADSRLRALRAPGETGYQIPRGGLYERVSCPNYLGEIVEWTGFALATWSLPALSFAVWTVANLSPRALAHHRWYRATFPDYPPTRRALLPYVW